MAIVVIPSLPPSLPTLLIILTLSSCRYSDVLDRQYAAIETNPNVIHHPNFIPLDEDSDNHKKNFAIYYLEEVLHRNALLSSTSSLAYNYLDPSIQHTLLLFLAKYDDPNEENLLKFLKPLIELEGSNGEGVSPPILDKATLNYQYLLRICQRYDRRQSCIYLYVLMNLYEKAVQLALKIDISFAKMIASHALDYHVSKKLWIAIIDYIIGQSNTNQHYVEDVLDVLRESNGLIRIEVSTVLH